jgi:hypothetical protein
MAVCWLHNALHGRRPCRRDGAAPTPPGRRHPRCGRDAPAPRGASTGEGDPCRVPLVRRLGQGQRHPQDGRCRCRRATIASPSPAGLTCWYRLCAARVFQGDCYERAPWYAAHPPVSTPLLRCHFSKTIALGHEEERSDGPCGQTSNAPILPCRGWTLVPRALQGMISMCQVDRSGLSCRVGAAAPRSLGCSRDGAEGLKSAIFLCKGHPFCPPTPGKRHQ